MTTDFREKNHGLLLGAHMSVAGGVHKAAPLAQEVESSALQIFVKNNNRWQSPPIKPEVAGAFPRSLEAAGIKPEWVVAHTSYLINLASPKDDVAGKSINSLIDEIQRCDQIGVQFLVMHPGSHLGSGREPGTQRIAERAREVFDATSQASVRLLFETTAGTGSNLGAPFDDLRDILTAVDRPERTGVCLDTCHIFAAGYDISTEAGYKSSMDEFEKHVGFDRLFAIHLNDSKHPLGSRKDRHEHIGEGEIGPDAFRFLLQDERVRNIPMVLETEKGDHLEGDVKNLNRLRELAIAS